MGSAESAFSESVELFQKGRHDEATIRLRQALDHNPEHLDSRLNLAYILSTEFQEHLEALYHYREVVALDPSFSPGHYNLAVILEQLHYDQEARSHYLRAVELDPSCVGAHLNLALMYKNVDKNYDLAEEHFRFAVESDPTDIRGLANLASLLQYQLKRPAEAIELYRQVLELDSEMVVAHVNLGILLSESVETRSEAETHFITAISLDSGFTDAHLGLARIVAMRGEVEEASKLCKQILADNPKDDNIHHEYALILANYQSKYESAAAQERDAIRLNPSNIESHVHLASLLFTRFLNDDEAADHLRIALDLDPSHQKARELLDVVLAKIASEQSDIIPPTVTVAPTQGIV